jgi:hypothetical protein
VTVPLHGSLRDVQLSVPKTSHGNTPWAESYGREQKQLLKDYAARAPRSVQKHLGPSELGEECDRQVVMKMARLTSTNHVSDPWASVMGTAGHAYVEGMYQWDNIRRVELGGNMRWIPEQRVTPDPDPFTRLATAQSHPGTADLYDVQYLALVDHKFLGDSSRDKLKKSGPKRVYYVQLLLYRRGYQYLGLPVTRVVLLAWPRTKSSLDELYVWDHTPTEADEQLVDEVLLRTQARQQVAEMVKAGDVNIMDVPVTPSDDSCHYCPLYRPQSAYDNSYGCPGTLTGKLLTA